jgi:hypothetical protein
MAISLILNLLTIFSALILIQRFFYDFHILNKTLIGFSLGLAQIILTEQINYTN